MKVLHVTPSFHPAYHFGGPIAALKGLCDNLPYEAGLSVRVLTTDTTGPRSNDRLEQAGFPASMPAGYDVYYCKKTIGADFSLKLLKNLPSFVQWSDVIHLTGVYSFTTFPTLTLAHQYGKPVVWSPRGSLQRWDSARLDLRKDVWEKICRLLRSSSQTAFLFTSETERAESLERIPVSRSFIVPHGVSIPAPAGERAWKPEGELRILFLGRLHPVKALDRLIHALPLTDTRCRLTLAGPGTDDYARTLQSLVKQHKLEERVSFAGPVPEEKKARLFFEHDVCVLPSHSENFGLVIAEALAHAVPVIASDGTPWGDVAARGCGIVTSNTPEALAAAIDAISEADTSGMGRAGRKWMEREFSWDTIARRTADIYAAMGSTSTESKEGPEGPG